AEQQVPCLFHANEPVGHDYPGKSRGDLHSIYRLLQKLPENRIILAHWGGGFFFYELMPEVGRAARNVFYDTAASPYLYEPRIYNLALKIIGKERILFGSDFPLLSPPRYFAELEQCRLTKTALAGIKGGNAQRLFRPVARRSPGPGGPQP
ncbi:MAG: amidohydrolase family protein, partial [Deltaproteobacteria bacterium]|nr:amidohydrolase family protein [Deltaproteobacteria bacterium]